MKFPVLKLVSTSTATTYSFTPQDKGEFGWATCTVNDATCELSIHSDWGEWSYGWGRGNFGEGRTLTSFIGTVTGTDYLAGKLQHGDGTQFSGEATVKALCQRLCKMRLRDGRGQFDNRLEPEDLNPDGSVPSTMLSSHDEHGLPLLSERYERREFEWQRPCRLPYLTRDMARQVWNDLHSLDDCDIMDTFLDRVHRVEFLTTHVTDEPYEYCRDEQTNADRVLKETILPALIAACRETHDRRSQPV